MTANKDIAHKTLRRMLVVFVITAFTGAGFLIYGFVSTQVVNGDYWRQRSKERKEAVVTDPAKRGDIISSDGRTLATTIVVCDLYLDLGSRVVNNRDGAPMIVDGHVVRDTTIRDRFFYRHIDTVCYLIHQVIPSYSEKDIKRKLISERRSAKPSQCMLVVRDFPYTMWLKLCEIEGWGRGIIQTVDNRDVRHQKRIRIYENLAANVVGFRNGLLDRYTGLEGKYDSLLRGQDGIYAGRRLTRGTWLLTNHKMRDSAGVATRPRIDGGNIVTTIDTRFQDIADNALRSALLRHKASSGCVVLMDVQTGYVLACANLCNDSVHPTNFAERIDRNIACADQLQPGSTFKTVVLAAMMSDTSAHIDTAMLLRSRNKNFDGTPEGELVDEHPIGDTISIAEAIIHSSNVAMADLGWQIYHTRRNDLVEQVQRVFPGDILNLDLRVPEYRQRINNMRYTRDFLNFCFGYSTAVSPMQLLTFYNAIAADGRMVKPLFCKSAEIDGKMRKFPPVVLDEHIVDRGTARYLQQVMRRVVTEGTATNISTASYGIAGKTGTAKVCPTGFCANDAFFVGFFPTDKPKYSAIVVVRNTFGSGGGAAAPVFKRLADGVMALDKDLGSLKMEQIVWNTKPSSLIPINVKGYKDEIEQSFELIGKDFPLSDSTYRWVTFDEGYRPYAPKYNVMPNCKGMTIKDAMRLLHQMGLRVNFSGCGRVAVQTPKPRTPIAPGTMVQLTLNN